MRPACGRYEALQKQLTALEKCVPNTPAGERMLWKKKKGLCDEMEKKLDFVRATAKAHPSSGSVAAVSKLKDELTARATSGWA